MMERWRGHIYNVLNDQHSAEEEITQPTAVRKMDRNNKEEKSILEYKKRNSKEYKGKESLIFQLLQEKSEGKE